MDRKAFFDSVRTTFGPLSQGQVDGFTKILDYAEQRQTYLRHLAYILATDWHETGREMQPIKEKGGEAYLKSKPYYPYYGRGLVQVTWKANYEKYGIAQNPDKALEWPIALFINFDGMAKGIFTGKKLDDYITPSKCDYREARRIVNILDQADKIAGYAVSFEMALRMAQYGGAIISPPDVSPPVYAPEKKGLIAFLVRLVMQLLGRSS